MSSCYYNLEFRNQFLRQILVMNFELCSKSHHGTSKKHILSVMNSTAILHSLHKFGFDFNVQIQNLF